MYSKGASGMSDTVSNFDRTLCALRRAAAGDRSVRGHGRLHRDFRAAGRRGHVRSDPADLRTDGRRGEGARRVGQGFTGDGIMALFGVPEALEDAPLRACRAGFDTRTTRCRRVRDRGQARGAAANVHRRQFGSRGRRPKFAAKAPAMTALGDTVNLASRLQALAEPGTVYLSEATQRLVQGLVETTFAGAHAIKGKAEPQKVYRLDSIRSGRDAVRGGARARPQRLCRAGARNGDSGARLDKARDRTSRNRYRGRAWHGQVAPGARVPPTHR